MSWFKKKEIKNCCTNCERIIVDDARNTQTYANTSFRNRDLCIDCEAAADSDERSRAITNREPWQGCVDRLINQMFEARVKHIVEEVLVEKGLNK